MVTKLEKFLYIFFSHWIDSKFLWCVHNLFIITFYKKNSIYYFILFLQSKVQKIKQWLWLLMVHASMIILNYYLLSPFFSQCTHGIFKLMSNLAFRFDKLSKKWQIKREVQIGPLGTPYSQPFLNFSSFLNLNLEM
jgi:hypothetical protein